MKEFQIQQALANHLHYRLVDDSFYTHIGHGGFSISSKVGAQLKRMGLQPGVPDMLIVKDGKPLFLEIKREKGTLSKAQKETQAKLEAAGAIVRTGKGFDQCLDILTNEFGVLKY